MATKKQLALRKKTTRKLAQILREEPPLRLDLGSGPRPAEGFKGVDVVSGVTDFCVDLTSGNRWLWEDNSVDEIRCSHLIEHLPAEYIRTPEGKRLDALFWFFQEAYRISKPGAVFTIIWPALQSVRAFQDPTHRRFIPAEFTTYLSREGQKAMGVSHYGPDCNWIGTVQPTIMSEPETDKDREMALRADSSDEKQAYFAAKNEAMGRRYRETWNFSQDFIAVLKAVKG